ncbi:hypothetical protein ASG25_05665 [Rhizobium sp. Leaf384]|uniref:hypothetical protein n=1 Tax=unclassified Rhizobium TaxID=2613769 RepID=UPI000713D9DE|nr:MULTISPECIES: hypothetical protein [unclassified Rhizobium]KQS80995.1 hypothetical protein ASG25_05665 [Rhizobium sp. Leaf384]KQS86857.1 hypothetical protein ASG58_00965 [Rhizobium sp. Leaf383]
MSEAERQAQARRERAARTLRENLQRRKQQGRARRAGDADDGVGLPAAESPPGEETTPRSDRAGDGDPAVPASSDPAANPDESST